MKLSDLYVGPKLLIGRKTQHSCGLIEDSVNSDSYIVVLGGSRYPEPYWHWFNASDEKVLSTEIFKVNSLSKIFLKGPSLPDPQFYYGSSLITSLDK